MKFLLFSLVLAFVASSALSWEHGGRTSFFSRTNINVKRVMYAAGGSVQCDLCEMVVGDIQSLLEGQQDAIENLLDSLCNDLPSQYRANCTNLVDTYLPLLFTLINDMTPAEVCELLTLCAAETETPELTGGRESLTSVFNHYLARIARMKAIKERRIQYMRSLVGEGYLCEACKDTIGFVHDAVACNKTWDQIAQLLEPLCELCPSKYRSQCMDFFSQLPGDVNAFADEYLDPQTDCQILGLCTGEEEEEWEEEVPEVPEQEPEVPEEEPEIQVEIPVAVRAQRVQVNMGDRLYDASRYTKKQYRKMSKAGRNMKNMKNFGTRGMDRMRRQRSIVVHVAGNTGNEIPYDIYEPTQGYEAVPAQKKCEVCRYFSSAAEGVIQYNEDDITRGLTIVFEDICNAVPDQFKADCDSEIKDVLPGVIYQMLLKVMEPHYLCTELIGICQ